MCRTPRGDGIGGLGSAPSLGGGLLGVGGQGGTGCAGGQGGGKAGAGSHPRGPRRPGPFRASPARPPTLGDPVRDRAPQPWAGDGRLVRRRDRRPRPGRADPTDRRRARRRGSRPRRRQPDARRPGVPPSPERPGPRGASGTRRLGRRSPHLRRHGGHRPSGKSPYRQRGAGRPAVAAAPDRLQRTQPCPSSTPPASRACRLPGDNPLYHPVSVSARRCHPGYAATRGTRSSTRRSRRHVAVRSAIFIHSACPACGVQQSGHAGGVHGVVLTGTRA